MKLQWVLFVYRLNTQIRAKEHHSDEAINYRITHVSYKSRQNFPEHFNHGIGVRLSLYINNILSPTPSYQPVNKDEWGGGWGGGGGGVGHCAYAELQLFLSVGDLSEWPLLPLAAGTEKVSKGGPDGDIFPLTGHFRKGMALLNF
jgi:hypothetical protein